MGNDTETLTLTDFLLARIAEAHQREWDTWLNDQLEGCPPERLESGRAAMRGTAIYKYGELGGALRQTGWALVAAFYPRGAKRRATKFSNHPDFREEWRR